MEVFKKYLEEKAQVTNEQFRHLEKLAGEKKIAKGEYLLRQEEVCDKIYFVEKGLLRAYKVDDGGKEHINQFAPENWFITDRSSILFNLPSEYFIDALEKSELIISVYRNARHILAHHRKFIVKKTSPLYRPKPQNPKTPKPLSINYIIL